jgi:SAM-dependent methyltransferase
VADQLDPGSRVLEVGCGPSGALAAALAAAGHDVLAIDPRAPAGPIFRAVALEDLDEPGPFDAVVAVRSLHHIGDLEAAIGRLHALLVPEGVLVVEEFVWDRMDEATARWFTGRLAALGRRSFATVDACLTDWTREHDDLHGEAVLRRALALRFGERSFARTPHLAHMLDDEAGVEEERRALANGEIQPLGFRFVGRPKPDR